MKKVLFVTSDLSDIRVLYCKTCGVWKVEAVSDPANTVARIETGGFDFVFIDLAVTGVYVPDLLAALSARPDFPPFFILSRESAFAFHRLSSVYGAAGYFPIPYDAERLVAQVDLFFESGGLPLSGYGKTGLSGAESVADASREAGEYGACPEARIERTLIGRSEKMCEVRRNILKYRSLKEPVLITGETGTGKDLVARLIHRRSGAEDAPYVAMNASCIPAGLAESLLFGTEKGCYTDARDTPGFFEKAERGTLFLDEIGDLDPFLQPKFLRVLEDGCVARLGSTLSRKVSFRLLCATNQPLEEAVSAGRFRPDLFYRIDVLRIRLPPLRERPEDIPALAGSVLPGLGKTLSLAALDRLQSHSWPGNVRSLFACLARAAADSPLPVIQSDQIRF